MGVKGVHIIVSPRLSKHQLAKAFLRAVQELGEAGGSMRTLHMAWIPQEDRSVELYIYTEDLKDGHCTCNP